MFVWGVRASAFIVVAIETIVSSSPTFITLEKVMIVWHNGGPSDYGDITAATYITPLACCPGDVYPDGGNGVVNIDDLVRVITQWSPFCLTCPGDINGDEAVNIDDLVAVITAWGNCP